jgi:hypothetical protein
LLTVVGPHQFMNVFAANIASGITKLGTPDDVGSSHFELDFICGCHRLGCDSHKMQMKK